MRQTRNPKLEQIGRKGTPGQWPNTWNIRPLLFCFFPGLAYWSDPSAEFWRTMAQITRNHASRPVSRRISRRP